MGKIIQLFNDETQQKEYPVTVMDAIIDKDGRKLQASIDAKYSKPATGIPESDLAQALKTKINNSQFSIATEDEIDDLFSEEPEEPEEPEEEEVEEPEEPEEPEEEEVEEVEEPEEVVEEENN